jgi:hypothetical protein
MLFYSTEIGKKAIVRQLQPHVHLDGQLSLSLCVCVSLSLSLPVSLSLCLSLPVSLSLSLSLSLCLSVSLSLPVSLSLSLRLSLSPILFPFLPHLPSVADPLLCESLSQFVSFMIQVSPSSGDRPVLGYPVTPSSSSAGRVYPWYIVPAMSRLEEIQPLVGDQNKKK